MEVPATPSPCVLIADNDPVMRLVRVALVGADDETRSWLQAYFAPEPGVPVDRVRAAAAAAGLTAPLRVIQCEHGAEPELLAHVHDADVLLFRRARITEQVIGRAKKLRLIQQLGESLAYVDVPAAARAGIPIAVLPRPSLARTAEHAILLMLALARRLVDAHSSVIRGDYPRARVHPIDDVAYNWVGLTGLRGLAGATLGIIGLGDVGQLVAKRAVSMGMTVWYAQRHHLDPAHERRLGVTHMPLERLLAEADFISLHAASPREKGPVIHAEHVARMKPSAFFINTARGWMVDEPALLAALREGRIAGAGLDVHAREPRQDGAELRDVPNLIMTPHCAGGSRYALLDEVAALLSNVRMALEGNTPNHVLHRDAC